MFMSVCLSWAGRLFHRLGPAAAKHLSRYICCRSVWRHVLELAKRRHLFVGKPPVNGFLPNFAHQEICRT